MLFNSIDFAFFLPIVFIIYWFIVHKNLKIQNFFLLIASYLFYGWWDWRFLTLIFISSITDFIIGLELDKKECVKTRNSLLILSLCINLGFLGFFKYYNFFAESFVEAFSLFGVKFQRHTLNIILPVGISFYTFQTLSYTIDVYRGKFKPTRDIVAFFAFVSFFPQLVAGPIERATNLLPQFYQKRRFEYDAAKDGLRQILWGLFKKVVIADTCAIYVNDIFSNYEIYSGSVLLLGAIYFAFQIYGDFSGYSDIAIGTAKLFGFSLMRNFAFPYFSRDIAEFWRRWHISLSSWFRDYVYIPLGGSRGGLYQVVRNVIIIFVLSGFWHGANWTFIVWGAINAIYFIPLITLQKNRKNMGVSSEHSLMSSMKEFLQILFTFFLTVVAWVFFRAENLTHAITYIGNMFSKSLFTIPNKLEYLPLIVIFVIWEWLQRDKLHGLEFGKIPLFFRWMAYIALLMLIFSYFGEGKAFIYFQF